MKKLTLLLLLPILSFGQNIDIKDILKISSIEDFHQFALENSFTQPDPFEIHLNSRLGFATGYGGTEKSERVVYLLRPEFVSLESGQKYVEDYKISLVWGLQNYMTENVKKTQKMIKLSLSFTEKHYNENFELRQKWINYLKKNCKYLGLGSIVLKVKKSFLRYGCGTSNSNMEHIVYEIDSKYSSAIFEIPLEPPPF